LFLALFKLLSSFWPSFLYLCRSTSCSKVPRMGRPGSFHAKMCIKICQLPNQKTGGRPANWAQFYHPRCFSHVCCPEAFLSGLVSFEMKALEFPFPETRCLP